MLKDKLTIVINSCGAYSDLWNGQIELLNRNWKDRNVKTIILTDTNPNNYKYDNIEIICAGEKKEITERLRFVMPYITTEDIFLTLDDYYLVEKVDNNRIEYLINEMEKQNLSYIRLYKNPTSKDKIGEGLYKIHHEQHKSSYYVNLYAGIWKKSFMELTINDNLNAWQYEVSLTPFVQNNNIDCATTNGNEYKILDVVRKGKILHKAHKYFKKDPVYTGNRPLVPYSVEFKERFRFVIRKILPRNLFLAIKKKAIKKGGTFYSPIDEGFYEQKK